MGIALIRGMHYSKQVTGITVFNDIMIIFSKTFLKKFYTMSWAGHRSVSMTRYHSHDFVTHLVNKYATRTTMLKSGRSIFDINAVYRKNIQIKRVGHKTIAVQIAYDVDTLVNTTARHVKVY